MNVSPDLSSTGTRARREPSVWSSTFQRFPIDDARPIDIGPVAIVLAIQYLIHGVHHAYPDDSRRWMIPLGVTLPIAFALAVATWVAFGPAAMAGFAGFLHGYLAYDLLHHVIHERRNTTRVVRWL